MKKLKLTKGLSFSMMNISCRKGETFCVDDKKAKRLLSTGRFELIGNADVKQKQDEKQSQDNSGSPQNGGEDDKAPKNADEGNGISVELIDKMKKDELVAFAENEGIDLTGCGNNEERIEKIKEDLGFANSGSIAFEEEG